MLQLNVSTGAIQHTFNTVPKGCLGATVWSSPTVDQTNSIVYVSTGNEGTCSTSEPIADGLVALRASDLSLVGSWQVPASEQIFDGDFGATPTFFKARVWVGPPLLARGAGRRLVWGSVFFSTLGERYVTQKQPL